mgnify:FL=1
MKEDLRTKPLSALCDVYAPFGGMDAGIFTNGADKRIIGPALTVRVHPGDHTYVAALKQRIRKGDIVVISTGGNKTYAVLDQKDCAALALCGAAGIIVDGMLFDPAEEEATGIPVFARGVRPVFLHAVACASVDVPISCGSVAVCPGDWIVADADGVLCIMRSKLEEE